MTNVMFLLKNIPLLYRNSKTNKMIYERIASKIAEKIDFDGQDFLEFTDEIIDISEDISISFSGIAYHGGTFEMTNIIIRDCIDVGFRSRRNISTATINGLTVIGAAQEAISLENGTIHMDNIFLDEIDGAAFAIRFGSLD